MATLTDILPERASHVLRYGAKIGELESPVSFTRVRVAMLPKRYPAGGTSIGIEITGNAFRRLMRGLSDEIKAPQEMYPDQNMDGICLCMRIFEQEYDEWASQMQKLETWIEENARDLDRSVPSYTESPQPDPAGMPGALRGARKAGFYLSDSVH